MQAHRPITPPRLSQPSSPLGPPPSAPPEDWLLQPPPLPGRRQQSTQSHKRLPKSPTSRAGSNNSSSASIEDAPTVPGESPDVIAGRSFVRGETRDFDAVFGRVGGKVQTGGGGGVGSQGVGPENGSMERLDRVGSVKRSQEDVTFEASTSSSSTNPPASASGDSVAYPNADIKKKGDLSDLTTPQIELDPPPPYNMEAFDPDTDTFPHSHSSSVPVPPSVEPEPPHVDTVKHPSIPRRRSISDSPQYSNEQNNTTQILLQHPPTPPRNVSMHHTPPPQSPTQSSSPSPTKSPFKNLFRTTSETPDPPSPTPSSPSPSSPSPLPTQPTYPTLPTTAPRNPLHPQATPATLKEEWEPSFVPGSTSGISKAFALGSKVKGGEKGSTAWRGVVLEIGVEEREGRGGGGGGGGGGGAQGYVLLAHDVNKRTTTPYTLRHASLLPPSRGYGPDKKFVLCLKLMNGRTVVMCFEGEESKRVWSVGLRWGIECASRGR
ncbi:hypothetical protein HDV00_011194 [Rhizophlyctis rosea]|nr:hypothetical protein HDV00_011194 [Rhizophlyctis rosea]